MKDGLKTQYNAVISEYIARFSERNDLEFDPDDYQSDYFFFTGGLYLFSINDIRLDVDQNPEPRTVIRWYCSKERVVKNINYRSYLMGLRMSDL